MGDDKVDAKSKAAEASQGEEEIEEVEEEVAVIGEEDEEEEEVEEEETSARLKINQTSYFIINHIITIFSSNGIQPC